MSPSFRLWHWQTALLFVIFFGIRALSFVLVQHDTTQIFFASILAAGFTYLCITRPHLAFLALVTEIFLGGGGQFFELAGLSIRTFFVALFLIVTAIHILLRKEWQFFVLPRPLLYSLLAVLTSVFVSGIVGVLNQHSFVAVIQDALPFSYLLLIYPAIYFSSRFKQTDYHFLFRLLFVFLSASAIFSFALFLAYSNGWAEIHRPFYNWIRDVGLGKVTDLDTGFFRIVLPEHLLLPGVILIVASARMHVSQYHNVLLTLLFFTAIPLLLNFSRAYILGIVVGLFCLKYKTPILRWFYECALVGVLLTSLFIGLNLIGSHGKSVGLELLGFRFGAIVQPNTEESAATRTLLLRPIFELIQKNPLLGNGLGASITFWNPYLKQFTTTRHFDWGYLELFAELGVIGLFSFLAYISALGYALQRRIKEHRQPIFLYTGALSALVASLLTHIFTPALFHILGIVFLVFVSSTVCQKKSTA